MAENVTALAVAQNKGLAPPFDFSAEQRKMIRDSFANGASDSEFAVLMEVAKARRLNPLMRQIYFVKRWDGQKKCEVWSTQISIDGLRAVAERTGLYDGQGEPLYEYEQGQSDKVPRKCTIHVYRKDWSAGRSAVGVAYFSEYAQTKRDGGLTSFWATKPHIMLAKCAEALAIRKAFPEDTSGLYVPEEMGEAPPAEPHAEVVEPTAGRLQAPPPAAAQTVEAKPVPKSPPVHVTALWNKVKAKVGEEKAKDPAKTRDEFKRGAFNALGPDAPASNTWTVEQTAAVEAAIFGPDDIAF